MPAFDDLIRRQHQLLDEFREVVLNLQQQNNLLVDDHPPRGYDNDNRNNNLDLPKDVFFGLEGGSNGVQFSRRLPPAFEAIAGPSKHSLHFGLHSAAFWSFETSATPGTTSIPGGLHRHFQEYSSIKMERAPYPNLHLPPKVERLIAVGDVNAVKIAVGEDNLVRYIRLN